ncbi:barstar family protein [Gordonia sp. NPDC003376]
MTAQTLSLAEFLADGPLPGLADRRMSTDDATATLPATLPDGVELRVTDGARLRTRKALFTEFARIWTFPAYFGHNADAFDECMRDLDEFARDAGKPTPTGYLTVITGAQRLLTSASEFAWFAQSITFYRDHYRDVASPPAPFAVLLAAPETARAEVIARWRSAGMPPVRVTV